MAFAFANPQNSQALARHRNLIYEGPLLKQGRINRSWRSRWFVLYNTRKLAYYNDKKESTALRPIAEIDLTKVENIVNDRSKDVQNKYVFELITSNRTFYLACLDMESLNQWEKYLFAMVFGQQIHVGWLIKKGDRIQSWRKRWFTLSNLRELRYYEDETQKKSKGTIGLANVSIIRHGDKEQYGYEYTIEIITPDRTWVLVTTYHELRELWMEKLDEAMCGGIKMNLLYQGWLWKFEDHDLPNWGKKFYGIDRQTLNLYYVQSYNKFKQFASTLFFDNKYYTNAVQTQLQGNLPIRNSIVEQYGNDDPRFDNTSQKSNPWIFRIRNVLGEHYFAADNELGMNEWIHHLNWALGSGPDKVVNKVTKGAMDQHNHAHNDPHVPHGQFLDDDYLDKYQPHKPAKQYQPHQYQAPAPAQAQPPPPPPLPQPPPPNKHKAVIKMQKPRNADIILQMAKQPQQPQQAPPQMMSFKFGADGLPIMDDGINSQKQKQQSSQSRQMNKRELELISKWSDIISPYTHSPLKLESEAQFPCNINIENEYLSESSEMHAKCGCVERVSVLMDYYMYWMGSKQQNSSGEQLMGMSYLLSILSDYSMTELLNDFFHLKRFHSEDIADNYLIESLTTYFSKNYGGCPIEQCVSITRNNLNYTKCRDETILRKWYYIAPTLVGNSLEWEEIVTQQILDMLHCYIYHGSNFALYDTTSQHEIEYIRKIYSTRKQLFHHNRYITNISTYHHLPYKPMEMVTPNGNNPLLQQNGHSHMHGGNAKYNDTAQMYEYTDNSFGIDMEHNMYQRAVKMYGPSKYYDFKQEILSHNSCSLSPIQFNIVCLKASILLSTFQGKLLKSRTIHDLGLTFELDPKLYSANQYMTDEMCHALLLYCNCEELRGELMKTYFKITHINETDNDCRRRHYNAFYNWGKLLYSVLIAFGTDIYNDSSVNNSAFMKVKVAQKFFYHNVAKPMLFNKFKTSFYGPTSCTTSKNIALIHMPTPQREGIVLELDTNNVGWTTPFYLNVSMFSNNPAECEQLFHGGASLGIHNIISVYHHKELSNLSNYTSAITLLRYIIGDHSNNQKNTYPNEQKQDSGNDFDLDEFDQSICKHLEWLIDHQVEIYKNNKNINDYQHFSSDVPLYIALVLNSWCLHKQGIIQLNMHLLRKLPKPLQHKFVYESPDNLNDYSINWSVVFNLFPNCNKIWKRGLYFNNYLCEQYVNFLCSEHITPKKYKMDGIVFSCTAETDWKLWVTTAKKHSSIIKQMGWLITASPPKKNVWGAIETGRVSFIKRINNKQ